MSTSEASFLKNFGTWMARLLRWVWTGLGVLLRILVLAWAGLAIHYSNLPWPWLRTLLAVVFVAFGVWVFWRKRGARIRWTFWGLFLAA